MQTQMPPYKPVTFPDQALIVFSAAHQAMKIDALRLQKAEAAMVSFEFIRTPKTHQDIVEGFDWPCRLYLDSGAFSLIRKSNASRIKIHSAKKTNSTQNEIAVEFESLANRYIEYLDKYAGHYDHVAEMDCDQIPGLGPAVADVWRQKLYEVVGNRLLPVWHQIRGREYATANGHDVVGSAIDPSWKELCRTFPYVAIGSDPGIRGEGARSRQHLIMFRKMVQYAHACGVKVHGMGSTTLDIYEQVGWDTADSTTWISSTRYGRYGEGIYHYSEKAVSNHSKVDSARARVAEDFMRQHDIDPAQVKRSGQTMDKLRLGILMLQIRQQKIRDTFARRAE